MVGNKRKLETGYLSGLSDGISNLRKPKEACENAENVMVHDVLATYTDEEHNATLRTFYSIFGDVQTIDEVIASLKRGVDKAAA